MYDSKIGSDIDKIMSRIQWNSPIAILQFDYTFERVETSVFFWVFLNLIMNYFLIAVGSL